MFDVGGGELLLIGLAILLLFGPKKIPEISKMAGKGLRELRKAQMEFQRSIHTISAEVEDAASLETTKKPVVQKISSSSEISEHTTSEVVQATTPEATIPRTVSDETVNTNSDVAEEKVVIKIKPSSGSVAR